MSKRAHLVDGWHDLPGGGSVEVKNEIPVNISDKGRDFLEETKILLEAAEYTETKLQWFSNSRSNRWNQNGFVKVLFDAITNTPMRQHWSFAPVLRDACSGCGNDVGVRWIDRSTEPFRQWVCEACALEESQETDA